VKKRVIRYTVCICSVKIQRSRRVPVH